MEGAIALGVAILITLGTTVYLAGTLAKSIRNEKRAPMRLWKNFGLSLGFCALFFITWLGQGIAQYQTYVDEQRDHKEPVELGDFTSHFLQATLENWQSEFLQLFSFTVMSAILIHKGSAESRDADDRMEEALKRIEDKLGTQPTMRDDPLRQGQDLHVLPDGFQAWALSDESSTEPEGYYDTQEEAIRAGRALAARRGVKLVIRSPDGTPRAEEDKS